MFFVEVIPKVVIISTAEGTVEAISRDFEIVSDALGSTDNRADLSQRLMELFADLPTKTVKTHVVRWCRELSGAAALRKLKCEMLSDDDMAILKSQFSGASELRRIEKKRKAKKNPG